MVNHQVKFSSRVEFLQRFASHILPSGFIRIRHYGFLASRNKPIELNIAKKERSQPEWQSVKYSWIQIAQEKLNYNPECCPHCHQESLVIIQIIEPERGPPNKHDLMDKPNSQNITFTIKPLTRKIPMNFPY